ncbi:MAG: transporter [Burkholderiales bacterium]|nr:MAG: transporter [Burkholderiales bacterium]
MSMKRLPFACALFIGSACMMNSALAAEGFQVRYNISGSLGGEMFVPPDQAGLAVGIAATHVRISKVTGGDGNALQTTTPGGTVNVPGLPSAANPSYGANNVQVNATGLFDLYNLGIGYVTTERFGGGRLAWLLNVPYGVKDQRFSASATPPALNWPSSTLPSQAAKTAVTQQFDANYMSQVHGSADAESDKVDGLGDVELQGGWLMTTEQLRLLVGASVVLPTGRYQSKAGPDIGYGNFYTFRPAVQVAWLPRPDLSLATKLTVGINSRNEDNQLRSGNWVGLEAALAYMTPLGPIGLHSVVVRQVQDDSGNSYGAMRYASTNAGVFFTTRIPGLDAVMTLQNMRTVDSQYAKHGTFQQVRIVKLF